MNKFFARCALRAMRAMRAVRRPLLATATACAIVIGALLGAAFAADAPQSTPPLPPPPASAPENTGPNTAITRRASGVYRYESLDGGRVRGEERWQLLVHPDGTRTLLMWHDLFARNAQFTVVLRNDAAFRPVDAFVSYWNAGRFKGSAHINVEGAKLTAMSHGPAGAIARDTDVPAVFSIGTHPVAADGWHTAGYDDARGGVQTLQRYSMEASTDLTLPVLGTMLPLQVERVGVETVEVPAGRFEAMHWKVAGMNDLYVVGPDRLVVKSVIPARGLQYVLTSGEGLVSSAAIPAAVPAVRAP
jgi:hypothetical protein